MNCRQLLSVSWLLWTVIVFLVAAPARAADAPKLAIKGYDSVAYFTESRPVEGKPEFAHDWDGMRYQFSSAANRDRFAADPDRYAPNYAGSCAATMARGGFRQPADPKYWLIIDGKLYVFAAQVGVDRFMKNPGLVKEADAKWALTK